MPPIRSFTTETAVMSVVRNVSTKPYVPATMNGTPSSVGLKSARRTTMSPDCNAPPLAGGPRRVWRAARCRRNEQDDESEHKKHCYVVAGPSRPQHRPVAHFAQQRSLMIDKLPLQNFDSALEIVFRAQDRLVWIMFIQVSIILPVEIAPISNGILIRELQQPLTTYHAMTDTICHRHLGFSVLHIRGCSQSRLCARKRLKDDRPSRRVYPLRS